MTEVVGRYPLSTSDGNAIPLDIVRPTGLTIIAYNHTTGSSPITLSSDTDCFVFYSLQACIVLFASVDTTITLPADRTRVANMVYIPPRTSVAIAPPIGDRHISVLGIDSSSKLFIQDIETWTGLALADQFTRR